MSGCNKNGGTSGGNKALQPPRDPKRELLSNIGLFIGMGLLGFWFGIGATFGAKMVKSLEEHNYKHKIKWQRKIKCNKLQKNHNKLNK